MYEVEKIDLGALDPSRDQLRWQRTLGSLSQRIIARRRARSIPFQLASWARPTLAIAAALAILVWIGALFHGPRGDAGASNATEHSADLAQAMSQWLVSGDVSSSQQLMEVMGDTYGEL